MIDTILIDFDGVIRHWTGEDILTTERDLGLTQGTLFSTAFHPSLLTPAITGQITHEDWMNQVQQRLAAQHNSTKAHALIDAWHNAHYTIDHALIQNIRQTAPNTKLVLVTNATSRLPHDLMTSNLTSMFDLIINSSQFGVAKPDVAFYAHALTMANTTADRAVFIDDSLSNVEAAKSLGIHSRHHTTPDDTLTFIQQTHQRST